MRRKISDISKVAKNPSKSHQPVISNLKCFVAGNMRVPEFSNVSSIVLSSNKISFMLSKVFENGLSFEACQTQVQKLISQDTRKRFAAYYTVEQGVQFMVSVAKGYLRYKEKEKVILADPFLGSARTLTATIKELGVGKIEKVWGIEPLSLPALVAYAALLQVSGGREDLITIINGDAFREIPKIMTLPDSSSKLPMADIILTNPPFTRWKYLEKGYRDYLLTVMNELGYSKYITRRETNLQVLSMFLSDYILNDDGLLVSVLPASTFYTLYGRGYKELLREKYSVLAVIGCDSGSSFSEDSGFKEVILVAVKNRNWSEQAIFTKLSKDVERLAEAIIRQKNKPKSIKRHLFNVNSLPRFLDLNWLSLIDGGELRDVVVRIFKQGLKNGTLGCWDEVLGRRSIIRGIEMYGPDFFFVPNKYWKVVKENKDDIIIEHINDGHELSLSKQHLVKTLRKPGLYKNMIEAKVETYMLSIPPVELNKLPSDLQSYIEWGRNSKTARPAINAYGKYWYSHVNKQIATKKPFGQIFIPDKIDFRFKNRGVFANYTNTETAASKNFYIVRDKDEKTMRLLAAWFNSTVFLSILMLLGRKISETWTRFLMNDYLELPVIDINSISDKLTHDIISKISNVLSRKLPPLQEQLMTDYRYSLDIAILEAISVTNTDEIASTLHQAFANILV